MVIFQLHFKTLYFCDCLIKSMNWSIQVIIAIIIITVADSPWTVRQSPSPVPDCRDREFKLPRSTAKVLQSTTQHYAALRNTTKHYRILQCTTKDYKALKNTTKQPLLLMTSSARWAQMTSLAKWATPRSPTKLIVFERNLYQSRYFFSPGRSRLPATTSRGAQNQ